MLTFNKFMILSIRNDIIVLKGVTLVTRAQLKLKAKSQITNNILILFLCNAIFYVVSHMSFIVETAARTAYYPAQLTALWVQTSVNPAVKYAFPMLREIIRNGYIDSRSTYYVTSVIDPILVQPRYPYSTAICISLLLIISFIIVPAFKLGIHRLYLNLAKGEKPSTDKFLSGVNSLGKAFFLELLMDVFTFLWTLLLIVPGIIKSISYSMSFYVLSENPDMTAQEALNESKRLMDGHKMDYFILTLSFFWWYLLEGLTFGLAAIYVYPYISATTANFYQEIKSNSEFDYNSIPVTQEEYDDGFEED